MFFGVDDDGLIIGLRTAAGAQFDLTQDGLLNAENVWLTANTGSLDSNSTITGNVTVTVARSAGSCSVEPNCCRSVASWMITAP